MQLFGGNLKGFKGNLVFKTELGDYKMKLDYPPTYKQILKAGMKPLHGTVYTYGDTIYNPDGIELPLDLVAHEMRHMSQQGKNEKGAKKWYKEYLLDTRFRLDVEADAYHAQYKFLSTKIKDGNTLIRILHQLALQLAGSIYGKITTYGEAMQLIKDGVKTIRVR